MNSTISTRRLDKLGRITIPANIRKSLSINDYEELEIMLTAIILLSEKEKILIYLEMSMIMGVMLNIREIKSLKSLF